MRPMVALLQRGHASLVMTRGARPLPQTTSLDARSI